MRQKIFYSNKWHSSVSKKKFIRKSPISNTKTIYSDCNILDLKKIIPSARDGLILNKKLSLKKRSQYLYKISRLITKNRFKLSKFESLETGKKIQDSLNEIDYSAKLWLSASKLVLNKIDYKIQNTRKVYTKIFHEPVGIVGLIIPWNFPFIVLSERLPFILASGNSAIIKPSEFSSKSIMYLLKLTQKINLPQGLLNLITGKKEIGSSIVKNKDINMISFTGSTSVGKAIMKECSNSIKRLSLELGGKNSMLFLKDAEIERSINFLLSSFTVNAGQACVGISKVFIPANIEKEFLNKFIKKLKSINFKKLYGPISTDKQYKNIKNLILRNKKFNKKIIFGKFKVSLNKFIEPLIYHNLPVGCEIDKMEIFGPILSINTYKSYDKVISIINKTNYGLSSVVVGKNIEQATKIAQQINAGRIWINSAVINNYPNIPIGGFKESGFGRECGIEGIKNYTELKSIIINEK